MSESIFILYPHSCLGVVVLLAKMATSLPIPFPPIILQYDFATFPIKRRGLFPHGLNGDGCVTYLDRICWRWNRVAFETRPQESLQHLLSPSRHMDLKLPCEEARS